MAKAFGEQICEFLSFVQFAKVESRACGTWCTFLRAAMDCTDLASPTASVLDAELPVHKGATLFELCLHYGCQELAAMVITYGGSLEHHMTRNMKQAIREDDEPTLAFWRETVAQWKTMPAARPTVLRVTKALQDWLEQSKVPVS